jgi:hypothetical protein
MLKIGVLFHKELFWNTSTEIVVAKVPGGKSFPHLTY